MHRPTVNFPIIKILDNFELATKIGLCHFTPAFYGVLMSNADTGIVSPVSAPAVRPKLASTFGTSLALQAAGQTAGLRQTVHHFLDPRSADTKQSLENTGRMEDFFSSRVGLPLASHAIPRIFNLVSVKGSYKPSYFTGALGELGGTIGLSIFGTVLIPKLRLGFKGDIFRRMKVAGYSYKRYVAEGVAGLSLASAIGGRVFGALGEYVGSRFDPKELPKDRT